MIVDDFDIVCVPIFPTETYPPLIVDADAPLPTAVAAQYLQAVSGWHAQFLDPPHGVEELELAPRHDLNLRRQPANDLPGKYRRRGLVSEGFNHCQIVFPRDSTVKRYCPVRRQQQGGMCGI